MRRPVFIAPSLCLAALLAVPIGLHAASVGSGAPSIAIQSAFITAYGRGSFFQLVYTPPSGVVAFGTTGLAQLFPSQVFGIPPWAPRTYYGVGATILDPAHHIQTAQGDGGTSGSIMPQFNDNGGLTPVDIPNTFSSGTVVWKDGGLASINYALILPDTAALDDPPLVWQVWGNMYSYFTSIGVGVTGYPTMDTASCPTNTFGTCTYQTFASNYALFVYQSLATNFTLKGNTYTSWNNAGGITTMGAPVSAAASVTSISGVVGSQQFFGNGFIAAYPSSSTTAPAYAVTGDLYTAYLQAGASAALGFPTAAPVTLNAAGTVRQTFENGRIEQTPGSAPVVLFTVKSLAISAPTATLNMQPGDTVSIKAVTLDTRGLPVTGRALSWTSTNGAVASIQGMGDTAIVKAVGGGAANVYVTGEGLTSVPLSIRVAGVCCAVGEGAPSAASQQAFQAAVSRNSITVTLPATSPATRTGAGYAQTLTAADGSGKIYVIAQPDNSTTAWLLTGDLYTAYLANGGFTGSLGYPASDPLPGGVQKFTSGAALAPTPVGGSPVVVVSAAIAPKWFALGGIAGAPGAPSGPAVPFTSFGGRSGSTQFFARGTIYAVTSGGAAGTYFSTGLILARYDALSATLGALGAPTSDIVPSATGVQTQTFEGGSIDLQPGAAAAVEHLNPRRPTLTATPATVVPGGRVRIAATGFAPGANLAFTVTGQPNFSTATPSGAFQWDIVVPTSAKPTTVQVAVAAQTGSDKAAASYSIASAAAALPKLTLVGGDRQTAQPGSTLPAPVVALLQDSTGAPLAGVPVGVTASPGAIIQAPNTTDENGTVRILFRLPPTAGVAVGSISSGGKTVDFSALAAAATIPNFPQFTQTDPQSALATTLAELIRFSQNAGTIGTPNGLATAANIAAWLTSSNGYDQSDSKTNITNPWVAAQFAKASIALEDPGLDHIRDLINSGTPVGLVLNLTADGQPAGGTAVAATGIAPDGSILIADTNPALARTSLSDYLAGFSTSQAIQATVGGAFRIATSPNGTPFVLAAPRSASASVSSAAGTCRNLDIADPFGTAPAPNPSGVRFSACDGTQSAYEADFSVQTGGRLIDLAGGAPVVVAASSGASLQITRNPALQASPLTGAITAVLDSAGYGTSLAPGSLVTIFGTGFQSTVTIGGASAKVLAAFPFQINAAIPDTAVPGNTTLTVATATGPVSRTIALTATAPGIFVVGANAGRAVGAIVNADGSLNSPAAPAQRGQAVSVYCAGLGATVQSGNFRTVTNALTVQIDNTTVTPSFAGLLPGFVGLYQINLTIPTTLAPTATAALALKQGGKTSNPVPMAFQ